MNNAKIILTTMHEYNQNSTWITIICTASILFILIITVFGRHNENTEILAAVESNACVIIEPSIK